jgi:hypothetical protein
MTGLVRKATLLSVCGLLVASAALASVPSPCNSRFPCAISVGGSAAGTADLHPYVTFTILVKDLSGAVVKNSSVVVDFSACCNDIRVSTTQLGPGMSVDPPTKTVRGITDVTGNVTFHIQGGATNITATPDGGCVKIFADGVLLNDPVGTCAGYSINPNPNAPVEVSTYDLNGALGGGAGVGPADLGIWLTDFFAAPPFRDRSDYDHAVLCVNNVGPADEGRWLTIFFNSGSTGNGPAFTACP